MKLRLLLLLAAIIETACLATWAVYQRRARRKPPAELSPIKPAWLYWSWRASSRITALKYAARSAFPTAWRN